MTNQTELSPCSNEHARARGVVTLSIGVAELTSEDESVMAWLERADAALYRAKANGRNRVQCDPRSP